MEPENNTQHAMNKNLYTALMIILAMLVAGGVYYILSNREYTEDVPVEESSFEINQNNIETEIPPQNSENNLDSGITFGDDPAPAPEPEKPKTQVSASALSSQSEPETIIYSGSGFSPKTLNIKSGTQVTFVNESEQSMWVASSPFPSHSNYPSFNEGRAVGKGGMYTFIFTQTGAFNYQNDKNPTFTGTIIVAD